MWPVGVNHLGATTGGRHLSRIEVTAAAKDGEGALSAADQPEIACPSQASQGQRPEVVGKHVAVCRRAECPALARLVGEVAARRKVERAVVNQNQVQLRDWTGPADTDAGDGPAFDRGLIDSLGGQTDGAGAAVMYGQHGTDQCAECRVKLAQLASDIDQLCRRLCDRVAVGKGHDGGLCNCCTEERADGQRKRFQ